MFLKQEKEKLTNWWIGMEVLIKRGEKSFQESVESIGVTKSKFGGTFFPCLQVFSFWPYFYNYFHSPMHQSEIFQHR